MSSDRIGYRYYEFNCSKAPFDDARVRRALTLALNRKILTEGILQDATLPQLYGWVPYGIKDVLDESTDWRDAVGNAFEENIEEAKGAACRSGLSERRRLPDLLDQVYAQHGAGERRAGDGGDVEAVSGSQLRSDRRRERRILGG